MRMSAPGEASARIGSTARTLRALACAALLALPPLAHALTRDPAFVARCTALADTTIAPRAIVLPTEGARIDSATMIAASASGNQSGEYCRVTGTIVARHPGTPDIHFDLNLPVNWNGRALQIGGSGYDGVVVSGTGVTPFSPTRAPLAEGYATFGDDSGHAGNAALAVFGLVDHAVVNFGYAHLKKTHDVALALIEHMYGRRPQRMYFGGGSTGGREGYTVIQRYPDDYDGVIANSPALNFSGVRLIGVVLGEAEYGTPGGYLPPALLERLYRRTLDVCDGLDGAVDGIVSNVEACRAHEQEIVDALRCPADAPAGVDCMSDAQRATLRVLRDGLSLPYPLAWNANRYPGYNVYQGTRFTGMLGLGHEPERRAAPTFYANGYLYTQGNSYLRYFVARDPGFDSLGFDVLQPGRYRETLVTLSQTIGALDTNLSRYIAHGGKLITLQGLADEVISPNQTIAYYHALIARYGAGTVDSFMRLYMVPGYQHGSGVFIPSVDLLGALDAWVTHDVPPQTLVATDLAPPTNGRTRPLCRYPLYPRYAGRGSVNLASSFVCTPP
jgi:hypothetical protein